MQPALISPRRESYPFHLPCRTARYCKNCHQQQGSFYNLSHHTGALKRSHFFSFGTAFTTNDQFQNISSLPLIGWHTLYKAIYLPIHFRMNASWLRRTHHSYKVIQICRDNNLSHFCQITFFNSLQAQKKEQALFQSLAEKTPYVSTIATFEFLLIIPQIIEQKKDTSTQPFIYSSWTIQFIYK